MSKYNYKCLKCENLFDIETSYKEKNISNEKFICPKCGSKETKKNDSHVDFAENGYEKGCCSDKDVCDIKCKPSNNKQSSCDCGGNC